MIGLIKRIFTKKEHAKLFGSWMGHNFYVIDGAGNKAYNRYLDFIKTGMVIMANITPPEKLNTVINEIEEANNKGDQARVNLLVQVYRVMVQNNEQILEFEFFEYINQFVLVDDEVIKQPSNARHREIKQKVWDNSAEARFFFIQYALASRIISLNLSGDMKVDDLLLSQRLRAAFVNGALYQKKTEEELLQTK